MNDLADWEKKEMCNFTRSYAKGSCGTCKYSHYGMCSTLQCGKYSMDITEAFDHKMICAAYEKRNNEES